MNVKTRDRLWAISLMAIGISALVLNVPNIIGLELPLILVRIFGVVVLISLPVLVFTTVKKFIDKKGAEK